jgi:hypothetical protein
MPPGGFPQRAMKGGRLGGRPPNATAPSGSNPQSAQAAGERTWYASGPFWVIVFLVAGYVLVFQTLKG